MPLLTPTMPISIWLSHRDSRVAARHRLAGCASADRFLPRASRSRGVTAQAFVLTHLHVCGLCLLLREFVAAGRRPVSFHRCLWLAFSFAGADQAVSSANQSAAKFMVYGRRAGARRPKSKPIALVPLFTLK